MHMYPLPKQPCKTHLPNECKTELTKPANKQHMVSNASSVSTTHPSASFFLTGATGTVVEGTDWLPGDPVLLGYLNSISSPPSSWPYKVMLLQVILAPFLYLIFITRFKTEQPVQQTQLIQRNSLVRVISEGFKHDKLNEISAKTIIFQV